MVKRIILTKTALSVVIGLIKIGVPLTTILFVYYGIKDNFPTVFSDENGNEINFSNDNNSGTPTHSLEPFIMDGGKVTPNGGIKVVSPEYPDGLVYFNNGRVYNIKTHEKGSWSLNENKIFLMDLINENESKPRLSLVDLLNEQSSEITIKKLTQLLNTAINDLDGWVGKSNLISLTNIVKQLKGKTFEGDSAFKVFMDYYKRNESGDDFIEDVKGIGERSFDGESLHLKDRLIKLITTTTTTTPSSSGQTTTQTTSTVKPKIKWDNGKTTQGSGSSASNGGTSNKQPVSNSPRPKKSGMKFHDCNSKGFPYEFGCQNIIIKDLQECLGLKPDGKFGPVTLKSLTDLGKDVSDKQLTFKVWDEITSNCSDYENSKGLTHIDSGNKKGIDLGNNSGSMNVDKTSSPNNYYVSLVNKGLINTIYNRNKTDTYVRYIGPELVSSDLSKLDTALSGIGYVRTTDLDVESEGTYFYKSKN